ncbi:MAG TPA: hypothetical protein VFL47_04385, partial [Flavisolibacter sp.]|nr:hypothetical protein [Flavisolibacter sp.]
SPADNQSYFLKAQRFLKNEKDFIWLQVGSGVSPDESRNIQMSALPNLQTKRLAAGAKLSVNRQIQFTLSAGYTRDEYRTKTIGHQYAGSFGAEFRF